MHKIVPGVSAVAAVEVEPACGGGVALVRAAFTVGEGGAEEDGDASCGGGDRARLKDAMGNGVVDSGLSGGRRGSSMMAWRRDRS